MSRDMVKSATAVATAVPVAAEGGGGKKGRGGDNGGKKGGKKNGKGGDGKNGGKKGGYSFVDKEIKHDGSSAELAYVQDAADWYNHFIDRIALRDVEKLADEAPKRHINWDVTRMVVDLKAIYTRILAFASEANKESDLAKRMYDTVKHPQLALRGFPVTEADSGDWVALYNSGELNFGSLELSKFIKLNEKNIGQEAFDTRSVTCISHLKYNIRSGTFSAKVLRKPDSVDGFIQEGYVNFRIDTERSVITNVVRTEGESFEEYSVPLIDRTEDECFRRGPTAGYGRTNNKSLGPRAARPGTGRQTNNNNTRGRRTMGTGRSTRGGKTRSYS